MDLFPDTKYVDSAFVRCASNKLRYWIEGEIRYLSCIRTSSHFLDHLPSISHKQTYYFTLNAKLCYRFVYLKRCGSQQISIVVQGHRHDHVLMSINSLSGTLFVEVYGLDCTFFCGECGEYTVIL